MHASYKIQKMDKALWSDGKAVRLKIKKLNFFLVLFGIPVCFQVFDKWEH